MKQTIKARFLAKVDKSGGPESCWIWNASRNKKGYGMFKVGGKMVKAHRYAYELTNGPIPEGEGYHGACVLHRCDNPPCCNPAHLFLGTHDDNMADKVSKGRQVRGEKCAVRGERHGQAKLTEPQVVEIRAAYAAGGVLQRELAARFGVGQAAISYIVRGKIWKSGGEI